MVLVVQLVQTNTSAVMETVALNMEVVDPLQTIVELVVNLLLVSAIRIKQYLGIYSFNV